MGGAPFAEVRQTYAARIARLDQDREFLHDCNIGGEAISEEAQQRVRQIAAYQWHDNECEPGNTYRLIVLKYRNPPDITAQNCHSADKFWIKIGGGVRPNLLTV